MSPDSDPENSEHFRPQIFFVYCNQPSSINIEERVCCCASLVSAHHEMKNVCGIQFGE